MRYLTFYNFVLLNHQGTLEAHTNGKYATKKLMF